MAKELLFTDATGFTDYVNLLNSIGQWYNTVGATFENFNAANFTDYDLAATEYGSNGVYAADMPTIPTGFYNIVARRRAGGSPAQSDLIVGGGEVLWDGNQDTVAAVTLDNFFSSPAGTYPGNALSVVNQIVDNVATALFGSTVEGSKSFLHAIRLILAAAAGKTDGFVSGGIGTGHVQDTTGFKNRMTADYDANGNRTAVTYDVT